MLNFNIIILLLSSYFININCVVYYHNYLNKHAPKNFKSNYERKFAYDDSRQSDGFGRSVDIYENKMLVGACFEDYQGDQAGAVYLYQLTDKTLRGWEYVTELYTNETKSYDYYGWDVALTYRIAAVGAWQHDDGYENNGAVYIYENVKDKKNMIWNMTTKLVGFNNAQYFGISVAFSKVNDILYIGAAGSTYNYLEDIENVGAVYIAIKSFTLNRWILISTLHPVDGGKYDYYGISVSVDYLSGVVGAYGHDAGAGEASGAAYVYKCDSSDDYYYDYSTWYLESRLIASDAKANDFFGRSVAIYEDTVAIGADGTDDSGISSGSVYIFRRSNDVWTQTNKLTPPADSEYDLFGGSIGLWGDSLIIGSDGDSHNDVRAGAAWYYKRHWSFNKHYNRYDETWEQVIQLYASDRSSRDLYGSDVAIYDTNILIGAEVGDGYDINTGACYVYTVPPDNLEELLNQSNGLSTTSIVFLSISGLVLIAIIWIYRDTITTSMDYRKKTYYNNQETPTKRALREMIQLDDSTNSSNSAHNLMLSTLSNNQVNRPSPYADLPPPPMPSHLHDVFEDENDNDADNSSTLRL